MAILSPSFVFGIVVLLYLTSFLLFAIVRIVTGISIQRIGYFSLRRLAYTPKDGVRTEIRGLGIKLHRPTFAQPTWLSIVVDELCVTIDIQALKLRARPKRSSVPPPTGHDAKDTSESESEGPMPPSDKPPTSPVEGNTGWGELYSLKERVKRLHRNVHWLRLVDIVATNSSVTILEVGTVQIGSFMIAVDTRAKTIDQGHIFKSATSKRQVRTLQPAEWIATIRSILFTAEGQKAREILDHAGLNINGVLYKEADGLRDASIDLKLGRLHLPVDDIEACIFGYRDRAQFYTRSRVSQGSPSATDVDSEAVPREDGIDLDPMVDPGTKEIQNLDSFLSSLLRGIKEIQFAVSHIGLTKRIRTVTPGAKPLYLNASMKEVGIDLHRLDQRSPAHRMYFSSNTIAHQGLLAALSIAIGVSDGVGISERLAYIPMLTTTVRTTLPSKVLGSTQAQSTDELNANLLFANVVVTSPSVDLDPKYLPLVIAVLQPKPKSNRRLAQGRRGLISRFLPKANIKFSMHEPVIRISLPPIEKDAGEDDFDLIILSISSISLDLESSHSSVSNFNYALGATIRLQSHSLYYQTSSAERYDILENDLLDFKIEVNATPEVNVSMSGNLQTFAIRMIRPELSEGIREIVRQLRTNVEPDKKARPKTSRDQNFIRALPKWLRHFQFQATNFSAEVAGVDLDISSEVRGVALQLESWTAEYRSQRDNVVDRKVSRRRTASRSLPPDATFAQSGSGSDHNRHLSTDGRRMAVHIRGLEAFVVESAEKWEYEPFLAVPRSEVAFSASSDSKGPIFHVNSHIKTLFVHYSLYRHYAVGIATTVIRKSFIRGKGDSVVTSPKRESSPDNAPAAIQHLLADHRFGVENKLANNEVVTVDCKIMLIRVKAVMPSDPEMMLEVYGVETGRHRYSPPFFLTKLARIYVRPPKMPMTWARLVSLRDARVTLRELRRISSSGTVKNDRIIDINVDAVRVGVPHQVVLHKVFDNIVNTVKAVEQLHHRFKTGTNEYILEKRPEGPKHVPKISLRSKAVLFELEDGAFEWKLGNIYRTGLVEQQQRMAREEAFKFKAKKIEEEEEQQHRDASRRTRSAHPRGRSAHPSKSHQRSRSEEYPQRGRSRTRTKHHRMRYNPEGLSGISSSAKVSIEDARERLQRYNARSWKRRIDQSYTDHMEQMTQLRGMFWGRDELPVDLDNTENILEVPQRPALMSALVSDLHLILDKPSFPLKELPDFLHRIGKGMPHEMKYSLLIPLSVQLDMGEIRITLRDYPLPLLHVPAMKPGQSLRQPSWSLKTDFVIAEEYRGAPSIRHVKVGIVPGDGDNSAKPGKGGFSIDVRRTVSPVKTYSDITVDINTNFPTRIAWGASYQPVIQDMMMVIETFTKPQIDPSERTGFWDKIRLSFHSRILVSWKGDGDVHFLLKGTRDPYSVTGNGAGFLMCWRNDVCWSLWRENEPKKFVTVTSGDFILAIPDYSVQALHSSPLNRETDSAANDNSYKGGAVFKKVIMKLSGNVQWLAGLVFERNLPSGKRSFDFTPHYDVILKEPSFAKAPPGEEYDAFRGFRSNFIHLSIAVTAPIDRNWSFTNTKPSNTYNSVHLTPRFFTHFFAWWSMFGGTMSLPIRQGRLWPGIEKSSKKFGRHLATIKYSILLAPLYLSHIYKHKEAEDYAEDVVSVTGLKIRLDSFMLDIHQRREWFNTLDRGRKTQTKTTGMKIHKAQLDLISADVRAVSATIAGTTPEDLKRAAAPPQVSHRERGTADISRFIIPDNDLSWIDMDDFVELDWILPSESDPETRIMPLAYAPRFSYFRETDHGTTISGDPDRNSPFGKEPTHFCIMSKDDDPRKVQCHLIQKRLDELGIQKEEHSKKIGEAELRELRAIGDEVGAVERELAEMRRYFGVLQRKTSFLEAMKRRMESRVKKDIRNAIPDLALDHEAAERRTSQPGADGPDDSNPSELVSDFNNRFVIHNIQLKWNNSLRNTILRYTHQVSQRRGFVYYLSRRAVKFILDIVEEQHKSRKSGERGASPAAAAPAPQRAARTEPDLHVDVEGRIEDLLADAKKFVDVGDSPESEPAVRTSVDNLALNIGENFIPQNSYHVRLIAPQIQLQSEKNPKSVALVTSKGMELKIVEVMDKERLFDDISGLVQRRFAVEMDGTQFFVTSHKLFKSPLHKFYSGGDYGAPASRSWPPWVPMEVMFDFEMDPFGFKRVVQRTSASLRYDKYNTLRLKYNDEVEGTRDITANTLDGRLDHLTVKFPHVRAICDSSQYYTIYIIVLDLLLYNEPLEKTRSERLERIMLASDFSDLSGAPEMVIRLQSRIRQLEEIKTQFQIYSSQLDKQGWADRILLERDLASCEDELFFMMKAITTSQRKYDGNQNNGLLRWNIASEQIVWHLMLDKDQPLMEFQLKDAEYDRTDNSDGSHINELKLGTIMGLNLLSNALYPEMIAPFTDPERIKASLAEPQHMLRVYWYMLEAIAGIPVMDHFEVNLVPLKIQLEHEVSKKLFAYIFPGADTQPGRIKGPATFIKNIPRPSNDSSSDDESVLDESTLHTIAGSMTTELSPPVRKSLELRLRPTLTSERAKHSPLLVKNSRAATYESHAVDALGFRFFQSGSKTAHHSRSLLKKQSSESLGSTMTGKPGIGRAMSGFSTLEGSVASGDSKTKRFTLSRSSKHSEAKAAADDLTKMLNRASNYMTLAYVKIPSVVLCLSYKGRGERNLEDLHDFVFRLPMLEYRNKTWSNLDLALALKKDVIKALISHTGAIIGNKFTKHRPSAQQQHKLREQATNNVLMIPGNQDAMMESETSSFAASSPVEVRSRSKSPRRSFASTNSSRRPHTAHSLHSSDADSYGRSYILPASLTMTKSHGTGRTNGQSSVGSGDAHSSHAHSRKSSESTSARSMFARSNTAIFDDGKSSKSGGFSRRLHRFGRKRETSEPPEEEHSEASSFTKNLLRGRS